MQEAFKSLEVRVRDMTGGDQSGVKLMQAALGTDTLALDVTEHTGQSGKDEREGFLAIFRGSMLGIRKPGAHELFTPGDPKQALEYLGFASLLHRRPDVAEFKRTASNYPSSSPGPRRISTVPASGRHTRSRLMGHGDARSIPWGTRGARDLQLRSQL